MKTTFDQDTILYEYLTGAGLNDSISGSIYKWVRPNEATVEDVVINSIASLPDQITRGVSNVNIYVPALEIQGNTVPDTARMGELAGLVVGLLKESYQDDYQFWASSQTTIQEEGPSWYVNIRVDFQFLPSL